jgi:hypothetical protein
MSASRRASLTSQDKQQQLAGARLRKEGKAWQANPMRAAAGQPAGPAQPALPGSAAAAEGGAGAAAAAPPPPPPLLPEVRRVAVGGGAELPASPQPKFTSRLSPKEWAHVQRATAANPALEALCLGEDGKVGIPRGWRKVEGGSGGFVKAKQGGGEWALGSINEVLAFELELHPGRR